MDELPYHDHDYNPCSGSFIHVLTNLLSHSGFRLIYVDENGNMSLVNPSEDVSKEDVLEKGYRCISHLWGKAAHWKDHPVQNVTWKVELREEKREKLLQIFNHYKGYWWIDNFCIDQESSVKPLSIMGDVYSRCTECVCMLDIKIPESFRQPVELWPKKFGAIYGHMAEVVNCKWNKRIWTLQEWMLSPKACYTEETSEKGLHIINRSDIMSVVSDEPSGISYVLWIIFRPKIMISTIVLFDNEYSPRWKMAYLIKSGRKCKNPEDYYYGIAGVFDVSLTDGLSFREVEKEFISGLNADCRRRFKIGPSPNEKQVYKHWKYVDDSNISIIRWLYNVL